MAGTINDISCATDLIPVAKSDSANDPSGPFRGILMDAVGTLRITTLRNVQRDFASGELAAGIIHAIGVRRVWATGTGAQGIKGVPYD